MTPMKMFIHRYIRYYNIYRYTECLKGLFPNEYKMQKKYPQQII
ncbi:hypothetical protein E2R58_09315 [Paenibacillus amylolyticus]|nr:hypothetical protein E2R58_09315 [Paenibacillus amylolyticus]